MCTVQVDRKSVKTSNRFEELDTEGIVDMGDSEDEYEDDMGCGMCGGMGKYKEIVQETKFDQKAKKKVRFEKMVKSESQKGRKDHKNELETLK